MKKKKKKKSKNLLPQVASLLAGYRHVEDFSHNTGDPGEMDSRRKTIFRSENLQATIFTSFVSIYDNYIIRWTSLVFHKNLHDRLFFFNDSHVWVCIQKYENNNKLKNHPKIENGERKNI